MNLLKQPKKLPPKNGTGSPFRFQPYFIALFFIAACATVPYTHRKQLNLISPQQEIQLGTDAYQEILKKNVVSNNPTWRKEVRSVGEKIKNVAERPDFQWEFNVLKGQDINAFCLPGGKVAFWEGIMPLCENETGIAVVMGHEIAHALAHHGAERMTSSMGTELVGEVLSAGLGKASPEVKQNVLQLYGVGAQVGVMLPFSRSHESEADKIGLILMAKAGYDPREAVAFWKRMAQLSSGQKPPEFLSTHPSDNRRIQQIEQWLPEALTYYKP